MATECRENKRMNREHSSSVRFYVLLVMIIVAVFTIGFYVGKAHASAPVRTGTVIVESVESQESEDGHKVTVTLKDN